MTNSIRKIKQDLRAYAKRCKDVHYTEDLLITFLVTGTLFVTSNLFSASANTSIASQKQAISTSIKTIHQQVKATRKENDKLLKNTNLELIQLMEQGDHVVKSPWSSWQFGMNYMYNDWHGHYKGRGDKEEKYPYEGIFERSSNVYERTVSPDSDKYSLLSKTRGLKSATGSAGNYGIASTKVVKEPIVGFEVNAGINPRSINKAPLTLAPPTALKPDVPEAIQFTPPTPTVPTIASSNVEITTVTLTDYWNDGGTDEVGGVRRGYGSYTMNEINPTSLAGHYTLDSNTESDHDRKRSIIAGTAPIHRAEAVAEFVTQGDYTIAGGVTMDINSNRKRAVTIDSFYGNPHGLLNLTSNANINLLATETAGIEIQSDNSVSSNWPQPYSDAKVSNPGHANPYTRISATATNKGTIIGTANQQVGMIFTDEGGTLGGDGSGATNDNNIMYTLINGNGGNITMNGDQSTGFGLGVISGFNVKAINEGTITLNGQQSYAIGVGLTASSTRTPNGNIWLGDDTVLENNGTINVNGNKSGGFAIQSYVPKVENNNKIEITGNESFGMYSNVTNNPGSKAVKLTNTTSGTITIKGSATGSTGLRVEHKNDQVINRGVVNIESSGNNNVGLYSTAGKVINASNGSGTDAGVNIKTGGNAGMMVDGDVNAVGENSGTIKGEVDGVIGFVAKGKGSGSSNQSKITNTGKLTIKGGVTADKKGTAGIIATNGGLVESTNTAADGATIDVKGNKSVGFYSDGSGSSIQADGFNVTASDGAVNFIASDNGNISLGGSGNSTAVTGEKSLLFYFGNGTKATGKVSISGPVTATIKGSSDPTKRGTAFLYTASSPYAPFTSADISTWVTNHTGSNKFNNLTLNTEKDSRLFIVDNATMNLSDTVASGLKTTLTLNPASNIDPETKTFMLYKGLLNLNQDINLDNATDAYNQVELSSSKISNKQSYTMTGTKAGQVGMAQENADANRAVVTLSNEGTMNLSGDKSVGMYAKHGVIKNEATGVMNMGTNSTALYGVGDSELTNDGIINLGSGSTGLYSESTATPSAEMKNTGTIKSTQAKAIGMTYNGNGTGATTDTRVTNSGTVDLSGDQSVGIYGMGQNYQILNNGKVTIGDSANLSSPSVGIFTDVSTISIKNTGVVKAGNNSIGIYGYNSENAGDITVGNAGIGIYSKGGDVNLTGGTIKTGSEEAVGVYSAGTGQKITNTGTAFDLGENSFGFVNVGSGNEINSTIANVGLGKDNVYVYSNDATGKVINTTNITTNGDRNYGIYSAGTVTNSGNIDLTNGLGNVGVYSIKGGTATNTGTINVGASDSKQNLFSIGMASGYKTSDTGTVINKGTINVNGKESIGMYASGSGSQAINDTGATINLGADNTTGIYVDNGATAINRGTITTVGSPTRAIGIYMGKDTKLQNTGTININSDSGAGVYLKGTTVANYGNITVSGGAKHHEEFTTPKTDKVVGGVKIDAPAGASTATITLNGVPQTPVVVNTMAKNPISVSASSIGLYVNTSGVDYTKSIDGLGQLTNKADLIIGTEATEVTNSKYILVNDPNIINPYKQAMLQNNNVKWNVYSGSLTWMATPTLDKTNNSITSLYLAKIPYTSWAGNEGTPVNGTDTYNFADGLEQRYGVEALGTRERELFQKLNGIGNNEEVLLYQAFDEMMGHQYGNLQQRINATGNILDKEFRYLKHDWRNPSKQNNKIKVFGARDEYNTDTAGIIDYTSNAYGVAYVHEDEKIKMGNSSGWYAGAVTNRFKFKDIGHSRENQTQLKAGIFKTMSPKKDYNGALQWTIGGDVFFGINNMKRKYLVVDDIFQAKSDYNSYGAALKTDLGYDIRMSERTHLRPYGALKMEYGRFNDIKEDRGEMRLEVKGNDYFSVKPEVGMEFRYVQPLAVRTNLTVGLSAAYENELGKMASKNNQGRVRYTSADWFGIRGEKEDRRGNGKFDLNIGVDNTRFGVTVNGGYDTKGNNVRGGIGFRAIY
ncbi:autotransporter-associated N-terminal domain-containing protein [Leptotrichia sp. oral taxon 223]|uniref:autotransporter-associated N-terminal domain-containing protein n=1 Tax=Leptotrichia sp. oral taxon 223 TaxID=712363 RepID=UPI0015BF6C9B|nr:autotransporter-associated N-terminal domain-containing protein [Leptotrichia sp. oral taxon 223]NWO18398.1 autotransporter-associated N-terminal domain-containing protein [Leptotrichia sp. oral taxon 223]